MSRQTCPKKSGLTARFRPLTHLITYMLKKHLKATATATFVLTLLNNIAAIAQSPQTAAPYQLPELLITDNGTAIRTAREWERLRKPEIKRHFENEVYGKTPGKKLPLRFETTSVNKMALKGKATRKQVRIFFSKDQTAFMDLLLYLPNGSSKPAPVFLGLNFGGNQVVHPDTGIVITPRWIRYTTAPAYVNHKATEASRGTQNSDWPVEMILEAGYGLATIYYGDLQPDSARSVNAGIAPLFYRKGQNRPDSSEWGAIGVWAWGLSRAMDYLQTDKDVDAGKVALVGHSRLGKTALWAGAQDPRFALVISNNSGEGGAAITRRKYGETIAVMNKAFPHWFSDNFKRYDHREDDLPVDFHGLIALIAPRPVYIASASEDQWADPAGEYLSGYHAGPVYVLYGLKGLDNQTPPPVSEPVGAGSVGYHLRQGPHAMTVYDWQQYLRFADRFLK